MGAIKLQLASDDRYMSMDPIGFRGRTTDLYKYGLNNPFLYTDPNGTIAPLIVGIGIAIVALYTFLAEENVANAPTVNTHLTGQPPAEISLPFPPGEQPPPLQTPVPPIEEEQPNVDPNALPPSSRARLRSAC